MRGAYSLLEADGTTRVVEYYADDTGFHADVKNIGTPIHPPTPVQHHAPLYSAHDNTYGYGDIAQFTGYGTSGLAVNYAHTPAVSHQVLAVPQQKLIVEQPQIAVHQPLSIPHKELQYQIPQQQIYHQEPHIQLPLAQNALYHEQPKLLIPEQPKVLIQAQPKVLIQEQPKLLYSPEQHQYQTPIQYQAPLYQHQPSVHAQAFAKVLLKEQAVPVQYTKQVQYEVPQHYDIQQEIKYIPEHINYGVPEAKYAVPQQIKYEAPIAIKVPQQKNVVIYENQVPQHQYVNYAQEVPRYYEKPLPYSYDDGAPQYYHGSY